MSMDIDRVRASVDPHSETAIAVRRWAGERIEELRGQLSEIGLPLDETEGLRYAIRELELVAIVLTAPDEG